GGGHSGAVAARGRQRGLRRRGTCASQFISLCPRLPLGNALGISFSGQRTAATEFNGGRVAEQVATGCSYRSGGVGTTVEGKSGRVHGVPEFAAKRGAARDIDFAVSQDSCTERRPSDQRVLRTEA